MDFNTIDHVRAGKYDSNGGELIERGICMHRMQILQNIADEKCKRLVRADPVEVMLGYLVKLSGEYRFPMEITGMLYPQMSGIKDSDLAAARARLDRCGQDKGPGSDLVKFLCSWRPMTEQLNRTFAGPERDAKIRQSKEEIQNAYDELLEQFSAMETNETIDSRTGAATPETAAAHNAMRAPFDASESDANQRDTAGASTSRSPAGSMEYHSAGVELSRKYQAIEAEIHFKRVESEVLAFLETIPGRDVSAMPANR